MYIIYLVFSKRTSCSVRTIYIASASTVRILPLQGDAYASAAGPCTYARVPLVLSYS